MKITHLSATELKRNTAEIVNLVAYGKTVAVVERYDEPLVKIVPANLKEEEIEKRIKKHFGTIPNFPDVTKERYFRKRTVNL